jgi:3-oxoacyl-[acyl-carrier protein] reductase
MSKAAIVQFTKVLALEVAEAGVRVNAVAPGVVLSGITARHYTNPDGSIDEAKREAALARLASYSPLGQVGEPDDVANIILYLISDASKFMTGQVLRPNGGAAMP